jgi:hypothetical protein
MATVYGVKIARTALEYDDKASRDDAMTVLVRARRKKIVTEAGPMYVDEPATFEVYERDDTGQKVRCGVCSEDFGADTCHKRKYLRKSYDGASFYAITGYICDSCSDETKAAVEKMGEE